MPSLIFRDVRKILRPKYGWTISLLGLFGIFAGLIANGIFGILLCYPLGISLHSSAKDQPNVALWFMLDMLFLLVSIIVGYLSSFVVLALILRRRYGWAPDRIRSLIFESRFPEHWLEPPT